MSNTLRSILCDRRSTILFLIASLCVIPLTTVLGLTATPVYDQFKTGWISDVVFEILVTSMGVVFVVCAIVIFFGMVAYVLWIDQKSWKLGWLVVFLLTSSFGAAIYCLVVYRKQQPQLQRA